MARLAGAVLAAIFALCTPALAQVAAPDPQALLAQVKTASGGAAWDSVAELTVQGTAAGQGLSGTFSTWTDTRTGYYRAVYTVQSGSVQAGIDQSGPWRDLNGMLQPDTSQAALRSARTTAYVNRNGWWSPQTDPAAFTYAGRKSIAGVDYDVVTVVPQGGSRIDVWISRATNLIGRYVIYGDMNEQQIATFSDYRHVNGILYPFAEVNGNGNPAYDQQSRATSVTVAPAIAVADFARPAAHLTGSLNVGSSVSVPFEMSSDEGGHIIVSATIDGKGPLHFVFDSGGANILTPGAAARLHIKSLGTVPISGAGTAQVSAGLAKVAKVAVGGASLRDQQFLVLPLPYSIVGELHGTPIDGLLGYEMLRNFVVTIDYADRTLAFADPSGFRYSGSGTAVSFTTGGTVPLIPARVDGIDGTFQLDTGNAGNLILFGDFVKLHGLGNAAALSLTAAGGIGGTNDVRITRVGSLQIGPYVLHEPAVSLTNQATGALASQSTSGNIGAAILSRFTLTFDYAHSIVYFAPNADLSKPFVGNRLGFSLIQPSAGTLRVLSVANGVPAAGAGLRPGDTIVSVNGTPASQLGVADIAGMASRSPELTIVYARDGKSATATIPTNDLVPQRGP